MVKILKYKNVKKISGWLGSTDFEIIKILLNKQSILKIDGSVLEIGVHHGKSFVGMASFSGNSNLYAIDLFDDQSKNIDNSGLGDKKIFFNNLKQLSIDESRLFIDQRLSNNVTADDIIEKVGKIKFFHIDGGHNLEVVLNDINLATQTLTAGGIVAIDDVFRPEWPEVTIATFRSEALKKSQLVCFAIGSNKSYFCHKNYVFIYQELLEKSDFLNVFLTRLYKIKNTPILIYQNYPLPEWTFRQLLSWYFKIYTPYVYAFFKIKIKKIQKIFN
jgi:predicted O-methyltransferase YrrM